MRRSARLNGRPVVETTHVEEPRTSKGAASHNVAVQPDLPTLSTPTGKVSSDREAGEHITKGGLVREAGEHITKGGLVEQPRRDTIHSQSTVEKHGVEKIRQHSSTEPEPDVKDPNRDSKAALRHILCQNLAHNKPIPSPRSRQMATNKYPNHMASTDRSPPHGNRSFVPEPRRMEGRASTASTVPPINWGEDLTHQTHHPFVPESQSRQMAARISNPPTVDWGEDLTQQSHRTIPNKPRPQDARAPLVSSTVAPINWEEDLTQQLGSLTVKETSSSSTSLERPRDAQIRSSRPLASLNDKPSARPSHPRGQQ